MLLFFVAAVWLCEVRADWQSRCAYDLDFLISRQPQNVIKSHHPTRANTPQPNELEYLDVFDLFNFPRIPANGVDGVDSVNGTQIIGQDAATTDLSSIMPNFAVPDPDTDWLFHQQ